MIEKVFCSCGRSFDNEGLQLVHQSKHSNKNNHQFTKVKPLPIDPRNIMFTVWAVSQATTDKGASILIHASLHVHLTEVIYDHQEPIDQLLNRREYERRAVLEAAFPYLFLAQKQNPYALTKAQQIHALASEPYFAEVRPEDIEEAVNEWRYRNAM